MVTKAKKALLASLAAFLCVMLTVFGLSMSVSLSETAKAADETTTEVAEVNGVKFATLAEAVNAVSDGGTIVVYSGVYTIPNVTYTGKSFTISAGVDQTVSFDMSVAHAIHGAKVSFNNVTFDYKTNNNYIGLQHADTLTYNGCTINGMVFLYATNETFNGCTFNQTSKDAYNVWTYGAKNVAFNRCEFNSAGKSVLVYNEGKNPKTDLTVSETKFVASEKVDGKAAIEIDTSLMAGGTTITIDGKTTATNFAAGSNSGNTLWNDKKQTADTNKNTTITVADKVVYAPYVVAIGEVKYFSLTAAIAAAKDGDTVTLLADATENVVVNKNITLDLNGFTLNGGTGTAKAAITNYGTLTIKDSSAEKTGTIKRDDNGVEGETSYYVIRNLGTMTIEQANVINNSGYRKTNPSGSMIGSSLICNGDNDKGASLTINGGKLTQLNFLAVKNGANGTLVVNGGEITSNHSAIQNWFNAELTGGTIRGQLWTDAWKEGESVGNTVIGGNVDYEGEIVMDITGSIEPKLTIKGGNLSVTNWRITTACAESGGKPAVKGGTFTNAVPAKYCAEGFIPQDNGDGTFGVEKTEKVYLAKIGETFYSTMEEAFEAQKTGEAIVLLRDYTTASKFNSGSINRVVDLNGHTWTYTGTRMNEAAFEINHSGVTLTVKNGKIISNTLVGLIPSVSAKNGTITYYDNAGLVFEGVTMTSNGSSGIETNGNNTNDSVTLKNSTLNVPNGFGIYFPSSGTLTIDNSKINAKTMGVQVCSGELNINAGSAITVKGDAVPKAENDGAIQDGAAISIVNRPGYKGLSNIVITGGTFTAKAGNDAIKAYDWNNAENKGSDFTKADLVAVSGGTFSSEVKKDYLAKGYRLTKTGESYGVTAKYIESTHVSLGTALSFSYKLRDLKAGETIKNAKASYRTVRGNLVEIDMTLVDGYYVFDGITPQMLDRKISVNVYVGDTVVYDVVDYSILDYLQNLLNTDHGKAAVTKQLVADLAFYGKAAMKYVGYTTTVVDKFIADNGLTQSTGDITGVATSSGTEKVANVSVQFASQNKILIGVAESVFDDYSYTIKVNGTKIDNELWQTDVVDGYRVYVSDGFAASYITDKDHYVEVEVLKNEVSVQKVQCNVAGYCMKMAENAKMGELAKATYYYGVSAAKYVAIIKG